jgi:hypothetical protein
LLLWEYTTFNSISPNEANFFQSIQWFAKRPVRT